MRPPAPKAGALAKLSYTPQNNHILIPIGHIFYLWCNRQKSEKRHKKNANAPKSRGQSTFDACVDIWRVAYKRYLVNIILTRALLVVIIHLEQVIVVVPSNC